MDIDVEVKVLHGLWHEYGLGYATDQAVGMDLRACPKAARVEIPPQQRFAFPCGLAIQIRQPGYAGFIFSRSGLGTKRGLVVSQGVGVIDPDYRGEIVVSLLNTSQGLQAVARGERIAQLLFLPVQQARFTLVSKLEDTDRGANGFGHTGRL